MAKKPSKAKLKIAVAIAVTNCNAYKLWRGEEITAWEDIKDETQMEMVASAELLLDEPTAINCHKLWMENELSKGWKYGEKKDKESRTSPYIVDYEELEDEIKWKSELYLSSLESYLKHS